MTKRNMITGKTISITFSLFILSMLSGVVLFAQHVHDKINKEVAAQQDTVAKQVNREVKKSADELSKESIKKEIKEVGKQEGDQLTSAATETTEHIKKSGNINSPKLSVYKSKERLKKRYAYLNDTAAINKKLNSLSVTDPSAASRMFGKEMQDLYKSESTSLLSDFSADKSWEQLSSLNDLNLKSPDLGKSLMKDTKIQKINFDNTRITKTTEKLSSLDEKSAKNMLQGKTSSVKKVYSEKALKKIYDSLGTRKVDSLVQVAKKMSEKEVSEDQLMDAINQSFSQHNKTDSPDTAKLTALGKGDLNALDSELPMKDLSDLKLPDSVMQEMPSIASLQTESKYLRYVDSLRKINLKAQGMELEEHKVTEDIKTTIIKEKPTFWDKAYFEGIVGVLQNDKGSIVKISPAMGYHFTNTLSLGLGPSINLNRDGKTWNGQVGLRTFLKAELWRQHIYLQTEDNIDPVKVNSESISGINHNLLFGGGCLLPISKNLAINPSILYRIKSTNPAADKSSPWVFRVGISSIGKKK